MPEALELLADSVLNPKFQSWEVAEQVGGHWQGGAGVLGSSGAGGSGGRRSSRRWRRRPRNRLALPVPAPACVLDGEGPARTCICAALKLWAQIVHAPPRPRRLSRLPSRQVEKMGADIKALRDNPQTTLLEGLHSVAYHGGLGRPLICPEGCLSALNADTLAEFYADNYTAPRIVLAGGERSRARAAGRRRAGT